MSSQDEVAAVTAAAGVVRLVCCNQTETTARAEWKLMRFGALLHFQSIATMTRR